jgi:hypothetical protein
MKIEWRFGAHAWARVIPFNIGKIKKYFLV